MTFTLEDLDRCPLEVCLRRENGLNVGRDDPEVSHRSVVLMRFPSWEMMAQAQFRAREAAVEIDELAPGSSQI